MQETGGSFFDLAMRMSVNYKSYFNEIHAPNEDRLLAFAAEAAESLEAQERLERAPQAPFDEYLAAYFAP
jgi:hypothetical protein